MNEQDNANANAPAAVDRYTPMPDEERDRVLASIGLSYEQFERLVCDAVLARLRRDPEYRRAFKGALA